MEKLIENYSKAGQSVLPWTHRGFIKSDNVIFY